MPVEIMVDELPEMDPTKTTALEVCKALDALSALATDLSCHCDVPPDTLILSAQKSRDACAAIEEAVAALKELLQDAVASGSGPIPPSASSRSDGAGDGKDTMSGSGHASAPPRRTPAAPID